MPEKNFDPGRRDFLRSLKNAALVAGGAAIFGAGIIDGIKKSGENEDIARNKDRALDTLNREAQRFDFDMINKLIETELGEPLEKITGRNKSDNLEIEMVKDFGGSSAFVARNVLDPKTGRRYIRVHAPSFIDKNGLPAVNYLKNILLHEHFHTLSSEIAINQGNYLLENKWLSNSITLDFYEGVTTYLTIKFAKKIGSRIPDHNYNIAGEPFLAFLVAEIVGSRDLLKAYLSGDISEIEKKFDAKMGPGAFDLVARGRQGGLFDHVNYLDYMKKYKYKRTVMFNDLRRLLGEEKFDNFMAKAVNEGLIIIN